VNATSVNRQSIAGLGAIGVAAAAGASVALSPIAGGMVLAVVVLAVVVFVSHGSAMTSRVFLWIAALGPFMMTTQKSQQDIVTQQVAGLDMIRAAIPIVALVAAVLIRRPRRRGIHPVDWILVAYLAVIAISAVWSIGSTQTFVKALLLAATFLALGLLVRTYDSIDDAIRGLAVFVHVLLLGECVQLVLVPSQAYAGDVDSVPRLRSVVPTIADNPLAYVAVLGLLLLVVGIGPRWTLYAPARVLLFVVYSGILLGTRTRTSVLIAVVLLVFALARAAREHVGGLILLMSASVAGVMGAALLNETIASYLLRGQSARDVSTLTGRTPVWNQAIEYWGEAPWLGHGFYSGHRLGLPPLPGTVAHSNLDNTWLETLVDVGVVGTLLLAAFLVVGTLVTLRSLRGTSGPIKTFVWCTLAYGIVISFVNPSLQMNGVTQIFLGFVILAASAGLPPRRPSVGVQAGPGHRSPQPRTAHAHRTGSGIPTLA
jgi:O-antigen ligase